MTTVRSPILAVVTAAMTCWLAPAAWSEQTGEVLDTLALPFAVIPEQPGQAKVSPEPASTSEPDDSTYHIGFSHTPRASGFGLHADAWRVEADLASLSALTPGLITDPSLLEGEGGVRLSDVNHDALLSVGGGPGRRSSGVDLTASYVWESSRFGQFIFSTRATYVYNQQNLDGLKEPGSIAVSGHPALTQVPELQSSLMFSWQSGNHQATATTHVAADDFRDVGDVDLQQLDALVGHIATLDLRYGYNIRSGRKNNTRISVGLRNTVDRRSLQQLRPIGGPRSGKVLDANGSVAYGTIKYQF